MCRLRGSIVNIADKTTASECERISGTIQDIEGREWHFSVIVPIGAIPLFDLETLVTFRITKSPLDSHELATDIVPFREQSSLEFLRTRFLDTDRSVWRSVTDSIFASLDSESVIEAALSKFDSVESDEDRNYILEHIPLQTHMVSKKAHRLRELMPEEMYDTKLRELNSAWSLLDSLSSSSDPNNSEHLLAQYRREHWLSLLDRCLASPSVTVSYSAKEEYKKLKYDDWQLASIWCDREKDEEYELPKMLSARAAEKVAKSFYESLGYEVEDVAITQLDTLKEGDWKTYDLLLNDGNALDVKNARSPVSNKIRYVRHCIPRFKEIRGSQDDSVTIVGVFSPYLQRKFFHEPSRISLIKEINPVYVLGETSKRQVDSLYKNYENDILKLNLLSHGYSFSSNQYNGNELLYVFPPWLFSYPDCVYSDSKSAQEELRELFEVNRPTVNELKQWKTKLLPAMLSAGITLPFEWENILSPHEVDFYRRVLSLTSTRITLPELFLTILSHFLSILNSKDVSGFHPKLYKKLVFQGLGNAKSISPLGLMDPLETCWALCDALTTLWDRNGASRLREFDSFVFQGLGLLRGKRKDNGKLQTLLAYCGGRIPGKGKCGFSPLIWGVHDTCPECRHLICPEPDCQYCSDCCDTGRQRRQNIQEDSTEPFSRVPEEPPWLGTEQW